MRNYTVFRNSIIYDVYTVFGGHIVTMFRDYIHASSTFDPYSHALNNKPLLHEDQQLLNKFYTT